MSSITNASSKFRLTGMATGIDTDAAIKQMMSAYYSRVDKVKQQQQVLQWKQDSYRDFIGQINSFKSKYLDPLSSNYILSGSKISTFDVNTTDTSNAVKMTAGTGAAEGNYSVSVGNMATKASSLSGSTPYINLKEATNNLTFPVVLDNSNNQITVDGKSITLDTGNYSSLSNVASAINTKLAATDDGSGKLSDSIQAVVKDNAIKFYHKVKIDDTNNSLKVTVQGKDYNVTVSNGNYTMESLASQINSKLSGATATDGVTKFPTGVKAQSTDGLNISFVDASNSSVAGSVNYSNSGAAVSTTAVSLSSTGVASTTVSTPNVSGNTLSYDQKIIKDVNDTLTVKIFDGTSTTTKTVKLAEQTFHWDSATSEFKDASNNNAISTIASQITTQLSGTGITADKSVDGKLIFKSTSKNQITITGNGASTVGLPSSFTVDQSISDKMSNIISGEVKFTVNGKTFHYNFNSDTDNKTNPDDIIVGAKNKSIDDIIRDIESKAGVDISYTQLTRQFVMTSTQTGASQTLTGSDTTGTFLNKIFGSSSINKTGEDATVTLTSNGVSTTVKQSLNNFTIDGVNYVLNGTTTSPISFSVNSNVNKGFDSIKGFIDSYNELIGKISSAVEEKKQYTYLPLTDEQKKSMSDSEIEKWETKAKQGILSKDSTLENMLLQMRKAFFDGVEGAGTNLFEVGLNTSSDIAQRGKIIIDEEKLKEALKNEPDKVMSLFTQKSTSHSSYSRTMGSDDRKERYNEEGIFNRISDIFEDNISVFRDSNGRKGTLLEIAGIKGDFTEYKNSITSQIQDKETKIKEMLEKIYDKEERYYKQFAQLETAMNTMNSQSSWLASQLGMSQG
ncbi:flagellar filament capping protein FliD [Clostridium sp. A1-XYC3]|uniref:Flagellar hook-associated protein 2 n=1 Tax=Clostridium tanneri TaxID=3037988 RepID=A0ABU4JNK2_9CLOT|nr:flagellar filament capping protein FliD [Clostridium sp. A1-XYC3]MDW8799698.1 flagellar filament capping protein FliD [Clostridium sp. A1-XYC3]